MRALGIETADERAARERLEARKRHNARLRARDIEQDEREAAARGLTLEEFQKTRARLQGAAARNVQDVSTKARAALETHNKSVELASLRELSFADIDDATARMANVLAAAELECRTLDDDEQAAFDSARAARLRALSAVESCESQMMRLGIAIPPRTIGRLTVRSSGLADVATVEDNDDVPEPARRQAPALGRRDAGDLVTVADIPSDRVRRDLEKAGVSELRSVVIDGKRWLEPVGAEHDLARTVE
jgi:hypothetical protein